MKKIEAIIRREKFSEVDQALRKIGVAGLTMEDVTGRGRERVTVTTYARGIWTNEEEFIKHLKLEIIVADESAEKVVRAIIDSASTNSVGDGKIFVTAIDEVVDIGSKETGEKAIFSEAIPRLAPAPAV